MAGTWQQAEMERMYGARSSKLASHAASSLRINSAYRVQDSIQEIVPPTVGTGRRMRLRLLSTVT